MSAEFIAAIAGYLCGSIPFGLLLAKAAGLGDVRKIGSGNIGATNVLRTGNKKIAALTLLCDALKGALPALIATRGYGVEAGIAAGLGAMAGHIFPVWLGFKGGKGVATNLGVLSGLYWPLGLAFAALWLAMAFVFRISSLAALTASLIMPAIAFFAGRSDLALPTAIMGAVIWVMHRANIARLLKGEEPRIDLGKKA
jgi:acyl phosphate:glycerol-3-phosphate acyltransferase